MPIEYTDSIGLNKENIGSPPRKNKSTSANDIPSPVRRRKPLFQQSGKAIEPNQRLGDNDIKINWGTDEESSIPNASPKGVDELDIDHSASTRTAKPTAITITSPNRQSWLSWSPAKVYSDTTDEIIDELEGQFQEQYQQSINQHSLVKVGKNATIVKQLFTESPSASRAGTAAGEILTEVATSTGERLFNKFAPNLLAELGNRQLSITDEDSFSPISPIAHTRSVKNSASESRDNKQNYYRLTSYIPILVSSGTQLFEDTQELAQEQQQNTTLSFMKGAILLPKVMLMLEFAKQLHKAFRCNQQTARALSTSTENNAGSLIQAIAANLLEEPAFNKIKNLQQKSAEALAEEIAQEYSFTANGLLIKAKAPFDSLSYMYTDTRITPIIFSLRNRLKALWQTILWQEPTGNNITRTTTNIWFGDFLAISFYLFCSLLLATNFIKSLTVGQVGVVRDIMELVLITLVSGLKLLSEVAPNTALDFMSYTKKLGDLNHANSINDAIKTHEKNQVGGVGSKNIFRENTKNTCKHIKNDLEAKLIKASEEFLSAAEKLYDLLIIEEHIEPYLTEGDNMQNFEWLLVDIGLKDRTDLYKSLTNEELIRLTDIQSFFDRNKNIFDNSKSLSLPIDDYCKNSEKFIALILKLDTIAKLTENNNQYQWSV